MQRNWIQWIALFGLVAATAFTANAAGGVTYIGHDKVAEAISKGGDLVKASDLTVLGSHRAGPGQVEVHDKETDVFYVVEGSATFITGGTMIDGKKTRPDQWLGKDIKGGETHHLAKGDVIVIPAGTPHWFKEVSPSINYYVVKVLKP